MMDGKKEVKPIISILTAHGWRVTRTGADHWRAVSPDPSKRIVYFGATASDTRALQNIKSRLKRSGIDLRNLHRK